MSQDVDPQVPSAEELSLQRAQSELLQQQRDLLAGQVERTQALEPILYEQMGLQPVYENGRIVRFDRVQTTERAQEEEIAGLFRERTLKALKGELEIDPGLVRQLGVEEGNLRDTLRKQLGPGYETSTPGMEALANFAQRKTETLNAAARGDMSLSQQLGIQREQATAGGTSASLNELISAANFQQPSIDPFGAASSMSARLQGERLAADQAEQQAAAANAQGWGSVGGAVLGAATYAWLACWVAEELFGPCDKTDRLRIFVLGHHYAKTPLGLFARLYAKHGKAWAEFIRGKGILNRAARSIAKALLNRMDTQAKRYIRMGA